MLLAEADELTEGLAEAPTALVVSLADFYERLSRQRPRLVRIWCRAHCSMSRRSPRSSKSSLPDIFKGPSYAGNASAAMKSTDAKKVITVRTASYPSASQGNAAAVENISAAADPRLSIFIQRSSPKLNRAGTKLRRSCRHQQGRGLQSSRSLAPASSATFSLSCGRFPRDWPRYRKPGPPRAVKLHLERRIMLNGNKTIVCHGSAPPRRRVGYSFNELRKGSHPPALRNLQIASVFERAQGRRDFVPTQRVGLLYDVLHSQRVRPLVYSCLPGGTRRCSASLPVNRG